MRSLLVIALATLLATSSLAAPSRADLTLLQRRQTEGKGVPAASEGNGNDGGEGNGNNGGNIGGGSFDGDDDEDNNDDDDDDDNEDDVSASQNGVSRPLFYDEPDPRRDDEQSQQVYRKIMHDYRHLRLTQLTRNYIQVLMISEKQSYKMADNIISQGTTDTTAIAGLLKESNKYLSTERANEIVEEVLQKYPN